jgi:hypothetical protein
MIVLAITSSFRLELDMTSKWFRPILLIATKAARGADRPRMREVARPLMFHAAAADEIFAALYRSTACLP